MASMDGFPGNPKLATHLATRKVRREIRAALAAEIRDVRGRFFITSLTSTPRGRSCRGGSREDRPYQRKSRHSKKKLLGGDSLGEEAQKALDGVVVLLVGLGGPDIVPEPLEVEGPDAHLRLQPWDASIGMNLKFMGLN